MGERKPALEMRGEIVDSAFMKMKGRDCFASFGVNVFKKVYSICEIKLIYI